MQKDVLGPVCQVYKPLSVTGGFTRGVWMRDTAGPSAAVQSYN